ncbi:MAG: 2-oxoacid:acceptor oxidoreductase family protein [Xanthobacteraceae bacterium]
MTIALTNPPISDRMPPPSAPEAVVMRFAGDSGDGIQLTGGQFTLSTALAGNDLATFPDFPAEIRAPQGTTFGVSAFQINFGSTSIDTAGDAPDVLMAMNPAALKVNLAALRIGGLIIADTGAFDERNLEKAGYASNPLDDLTLAPYQVIAFDITRLALEAVNPLVGRWGCAYRNRLKFIYRNKAGLDRSTARAAALACCSSSVEQWNREGHPATGSRPPEQQRSVRSLDNARVRRTSTPEAIPPGASRVEVSCSDQ